MRIVNKKNIHVGSSRKWEMPKSPGPGPNIFILSFDSQLFKNFSHKNKPIDF